MPGAANFECADPERCNVCHNCSCDPMGKLARGECTLMQCSSPLDEQRARPALAPAARASEDGDARESG